MMQSNPVFSFREFKTADLQAVLKWYDWEGFYYYTTYPRYVPEDEIIEFLTQRGNTLIIEADGRPVGICDYHIQDPKSKSCKIEIAFSSKEYYDFRGSQILRSYITLLFNNQDLVKLKKLIFEFDEKSLRLCRDAGMKIEGSYKEQVFKDGNYYDVLYAAILKDEVNKTSKMNHEFLQYKN